MVNISSLRPLLDREDVILGLDAYGVIYNDDGPFDAIKGVFHYCDQHQIPLYMITNNATQSITDISNKMHAFGLPVAPEQVISSGCGCYMIDDIQSMLFEQRVFVYGFESSKFYAFQAQAEVVSDPEEADVMVLAASLGTMNHHWYKRVHDVLRDRPTLPVICINPDHYIRNQSGFKPVMGFYAHQMAQQLNANHWVWMGKPYPLFSVLVRHVLHGQGLDPSNLVFCDDNPMNVQQLMDDLTCTGVLISDTGIAQKFPEFHHPGMFQLANCRVWIFAI